MATVWVYVDEISKTLNLVLKRRLLINQTYIIENILKILLSLSTKLLPIKCEWIAGFLRLNLWTDIDIEREGNIISLRLTRVLLQIE